MISLQDFSYRYPEAEALALDSLSLEIAAGEAVLVAGESGCGKTTFLRSLCGLVPHYFGGEAWGELAIAGLDARTSGPAELAGRIGYCAQEPETQVVSATVAAELELPLELAGAEPLERARAVEEVALALGIAELLERTTGSLSGGELQRVALGAALVARPEAIVLDEPTSQLDPVAGDELIGLLRRVNEQWGTALVIAEHRAERCLPFVDRAIVLDGGSVAFDGEPAEFLRWAVERGSALATPVAELFGRLGLEPLPTCVRDARLALTGHRERAVGAGAQPSPAVRGGRDREPLLRARGVRLSVSDRAQPIIADAGLELSAGEVVALMGRNGAGKTTLMRALAGRLEPAAGAIERSGRCALLPQWPGDLIVAETVAGELLEGAEAPELERLGLRPLAGRDPRDISGGERQRLAIAIATAGLDPAGTVLLLDEPTLGMDRRRKGELRDWLRLIAAAGSAVLVATHDAEFAAELCERVILLGGGRVLAEGPAAEVLSGGWYFSTEVARAVDMPGIATTEAALAALRLDGDGEGVGVGSPPIAVEPGPGARP